jgi:tryptophan halogenase
MPPTIEKICVLGGGSAGYLSAVTLRRLLPGRQVVAVHSLQKPVIGVGESTTAYLPVFLHRQLALDRKRFYEEVQPSWKLGIRFVWGPADKSHFNYPFGFELSDRANHDPLRKRAAYYCLEHDGYPGPYSALMDHDLSPCLLAHGGYYQFLEGSFGYHLPNQKFLHYLDGIARECGVELTTGDVVGVNRVESGDVRSLQLHDGRRIEADLFIDCSGFDSLLLGQTLGERFINYGDTLLCDKAVVGDYERDGRIQPYTTAETMDHGWCWRIELPERVSLGQNLGPRGGQSRRARFRRRWRDERRGVWQF